MLKEEQRQAVLGLMVQKDVVRTTCCGKKFNLPVARGSETQTKREEPGIRNSERIWYFSHYITLPRNHDVMWTFFSPESCHRPARFFKSWF